MLKIELIRRRVLFLLSFLVGDPGAGEQVGEVAVFVVEYNTGAPHEPKAVTAILWVPLDKD